MFDMRLAKDGTLLRLTPRPWPADIRSTCGRPSSEVGETESKQAEVEDGQAAARRQGVGATDFDSLPVGADRERASNEQRRAKNEEYIAARYELPQCDACSRSRFPPYYAIRDSYALGGLVSATV